VVEAQNLALRHVDYGASREHIAIFEQCLLKALRRYIICEGGTWNAGVEAGWSWAYNVLTPLFFRAIDELRPKVEIVRLSWQQVHNSELLCRGRLVQDFTGFEARSASKKSSRSTNCTYDEPMDARTSSRLRLGNAFADEFRRALPDGGRGYNWSESHGKKLGVVLDLIVSTVTKPHQLEQELWRVAQRHVELGVEASMLDVFETALWRFLSARLSEELWEEAMPAWSWVFASVRAMFLHVLVKWTKAKKSLQESWEAISARAGGNSRSIAARFYDDLFHAAPFFREVFRSRNEAMIDSFAKALDMMMCCCHDASMLENDLHDLAVRHCKFDLQPWHFSAFCTALLDSLAHIAGHTWCDEHREAWCVLFRTITIVFINVLESCQGSLCASLGKASTHDVRLVLKAAPRGVRMSKILTFEARNKTISPILWALRDGIVDIVELLLDELLVIRSDREAYYYGCDEMWRRCPTILAAIIEFAPGIVEQFLDGHMWVSRTSVNGQWRVNMWVRHLYGDPLTTPVVFQTPLGVLVESLPETCLHVFLHPVVRMAVDLKWQRFGKFRRCWCCFCQFTCLSSYYVVWACGDSHPFPRLAACSIWFLASSHLFASSIRRAAKQWLESKLVDVRLRGYSLRIPRSLRDFYVLLRLAYCVLSLILVVWIFRAHRHRAAFTQNLREMEAFPTVLCAAVASLQWIQVTEVFTLSRQLAGVCYLASAMIADAVRFMVVMLVWLMAVGAVLCNFIEDSSHDAGAGFAYNLLALVLGVGSDSGLTFYGKDDALLVRSFFIIGLWVSLIPILNVMIASVCSTFARAETETLAWAEWSRARAVVEAEEDLSPATRMKHFRALGFDEDLPFTQFDKGPPGGVSQLVKACHLKQHPAFQRCVDKRVFLTGKTGPENPWPDHEVPTLRPRDRNSIPRRGADRSGAMKAMRVGMEELRCATAYKSGMIEREASSISSQRGSLRDASNLSFFTSHEFSAIVEAAAPAHCFLVVDRLIYDAGQYLSQHPGGAELLLQAGGRDATQRFGMHANVAKARAALECLPVIGRLRPSEALACMPMVSKNYSSERCDRLQGKGSRLAM